MGAKRIISKIDETWLDVIKSLCTGKKGKGCRKMDSSVLYEMDEKMGESGYGRGGAWTCVNRNVCSEVKEKGSGGLSGDVEDGEEKTKNFKRVSVVTGDPPTGRWTG